MSAEAGVDEGTPEYVLAKHLYDIRYRNSRTAISSWGGLAPFQVKYEVDAATRALAAVEPLIRERLAQEVEADLNANADHLTSSCRLGYRTAARIVRGDAS